MTNIPASPLDRDMPELTALCARHLQREEALLACTLPLVRSMEDAFRQPSAEGFAPPLARHGEVAAQIAALHIERRRFRDATARRLNLQADAVTVPIVLDHVPIEQRAALLADLARVRTLAAELAAANHRVTVHLCIHLGPTAAFCATSPIQPFPAAAATARRGRLNRLSIVP